MTGALSSLRGRSSQTQHSRQFLVDRNSWSRYHDILSYTIQRLVFLLTLVIPCADAPRQQPKISRQEVRSYSLHFYEPWQITYTDISLGTTSSIVICCEIAPSPRRTRAGRSWVLETREWIFVGWFVTSRSWPSEDADSYRCLCRYRTGSLVELVRWSWFVRLLKQV
jgi:hypothetical protein